MIRFGPSGNSQSFYNAGNKTSLQAPAWLKSLGLNAYEYSFGRGYTMSLPTAQALGQAAQENGVVVSIHAPYYINLANPDEVMKEKSFGYITKGLELLRAMQGKHLVFHVASQGKLERGEALSLAKVRLKELLSRLDFEGVHKGLYLCPETMGKPLQIGSYKEIIDLCTLHENLVPTFDFGHINCITQGGLTCKENYLDIFKYCIEKLGFERTKNCHIHFSKIEYGEKGEIRHLNYDDMIYGPDFDPLAQALVELGLTPTIICESKTMMAEDALTLKNIYEKTAKM